MLWNLDFLLEEEQTNPDYKQLIDNLRTYGLWPYYLRPEYYDKARQELEKVNWNRQSARIQAQYRRPVWLSRSIDFLLKVGSVIKQWMISRF